MPDTSYNLRVDSLRVLTTDIPYDKYNDAVFVNSMTGFAVSDNGRIVKTIDGGYHWTTLSSGVNFLLKKIRFVNSQAGFVIGGDSTGGYLLKTTDAGLNWQKIDLHMPEPGWPTGLFFLDADRGFITGKKYFKKTTDGGLTWTDAAGPVTENFGISVSGPINRDMPPLQTVGILLPGMGVVHGGPYNRIKTRRWVRYAIRLRSRFQ